MGTHPIFESDFDCLTEVMFYPFAFAVRDLIPAYLRSVPIPYNVAEMKDMRPVDWLHFSLFTGVTVGTGYLLTKRLTDRSQRRCNRTIDLDSDKVVHKFDVTDMSAKEVYCRCWKSK